MTRTTRIHATSTVFHIVARFVDRQYRLQDQIARDEYLRRLGEVLGRVNWTVLGYALMSTHVHLALLSGEDASARLVLPVHSGFAAWLNRRQGRLGPVFADRHRTVLLPDEHAARLLAYVHNNPVRAGVVGRAESSTWTSHRAYLGLQAPPAWLDVEAGLELAGFGATQVGRGAFADFARAHAGDPRDPELSGDTEAMRKAVRAAVGTTVQLSSPVLTEHGSATQLVAPAQSRLRRIWQGEPAQVVELVARARSLDVDDIRTTRRMPRLVAARRLALLVWTAQLDRRVGVMAAYLGITSSAACQLLYGSPELTAALHSEAELIGARLWGGVASDFRVLPAAT